MGNLCPLKSVFESSNYQGFWLGNVYFVFLMKAQITRQNINIPKYFVVNYVKAGTRCSLQYLILLKSKTVQMSRGMRFPTMWYVRPAKAQTSLRVRTVWSELLLVTGIFYDNQATD